MTARRLLLLGAASTLAVPLACGLWEISSQVRYAVKHR